MTRPALLYFGERWDAPLFDDVDAVQADLPLGVACSLCAEPVAEGDQGFLRSHVTMEDGRPVADFRPVHRECELRGVLGGLDHVQGRCQGIGHCNQLREEAGRTVRQDALAVWAWAIEGRA
jgi:hypothetical protein